MDNFLCKKCLLYKNQSPAQNIPIPSDILIMGISSQKNTSTKTFAPLDSSTNSGKFILELQKLIPEKTFYKTNMIKCAPLNSDGKIRYPKREEIKSCLLNFNEELKVVNPKIIIPLGKQVSNFLSEYFNISLKKYEINKVKSIIIIPIDHPSYIMIYKRKQLEECKKKIINLIKIS